MIIKTRLQPEARLPQYQTPGASGLDLHALHGRQLRCGETVVVTTGVSMAIPEGFEGQVRPRSSMSRSGLLVHLGTIDSDYRGDIGVIVTNLSPGVVDIETGRRIAQLVICPVKRVSIQPTDLLDVTARGSRGFGSTGQ